MTYHETTIDVRGQQVRLLSGGSGIPLLYLHDTFTVGEIWSDVHERLAADYDVIVPIHPGCEGSDANEIDTMDDLIFHYLDVCEALQLNRPIVWGASLGGWIAVEWAVRYSHLLRGVILLDALGLRVPDAPTADILRLDAVQTRTHLFADPGAALAHQLIPDVPSVELLPAILKARQTLAHFAWQFPDNPKLSRYLYRVTIPTLIIWGEQDAFIPSAHGFAFHNAIVGSEFVQLPQCGHLPHAEKPDACLDAITAFLNRHCV
jgi:pimeloyl-ACP methyl ester carboxylesterase